jgi:cytochrome c oxidase subunit IV
MSATTHLRGYLLAYSALIVLLAATVWIAHLDLGPFNVTAALLVAALKSLIVMAIFMHLRGGPRLNWAVAAVGFFFLVILAGLTFSDYLTRA